jgi:hypothetical protein
MALETKCHNPTAAHILCTQLGAAKDREKIEQEWNALE